LQPPFADESADFARSQLALHRSSTVSSVVSTAVAALVLAGVLVGDVDGRVLVAWLAALTVALAVRLAVRQAHLRAGEVTSVPRWLLAYRAGFALHGLVWMALGMALVGQAEHRITELLLVVMAAMSGGALVTAAFDPRAGGLFAALVMPPVLLKLALAGNAEDRGTLLAIVMFLIVMAIVARRQQRMVLDAVQARSAERARTSEAERARRELADQTELQRQLLRTTHQGYWFIDTEGRTTDLNPAMCHLLGRERDVVIGRHASEFFDDAGRAVLARELERRRSGATGAYEIDIVRPDGSRVHCLNNATPLFASDGSAVGSVGLWTDITQQKRIEQSLRAHSWLVNAVTDPVSLIGEDRAYLMVNDAWCAAAGVARDDAVGRPVAEVLGAQRFRPDHAMALEECFATGQPRRVRFEVDMQGRGRRRLETLYYPYHDPDSGVRCVGALSQDVTQAALAQEALVEARDEAERANRAKSQFLAQMSHELRTPMNAIVGFGQLLENDPRHPLPEVQRRYVQEVLRAARHLLGLMNELLDLGRIEAGKLTLDCTPVPLAGLVDECLGLVRPLAQPRGVVVDAAQVRGEAVLADPLRLRQVLLNLLGNAVKYNRPGGQVRTRAWREGSEVVLAVEDTGPGLNAQQQARLFQPFERLGAERGSIEGTGIGLALSRRLVEAMGGRIGVHSEPGRGSSFWMALPAADAFEDEDAQATQPAELEVSGSVAVLYIEDNPVNVALMEAMLERLGGIELRCAALPEEGLRMAAESPPALILLDIQLPGMDGFEVLARLRSKPATADVPVVAVSANAQPADIEAARQAGFDDYLTKPLQLPLLLGTVQRMLRHARASA
jgi:PAS domain S-box-containing protein